jgi:glycosyltransferase involved in cell wall biosynthesis
MKMAVISSRYPSKGNIYSHMWVHARAKEFVKNGVEVCVFVPSKTIEEYSFEGVQVIKAPDFDIAKRILNFQVVYIHLLSIYPYPKLSGWPIYKSIIKNKIRCFMYLHGSEVQSTERYSFDDENNFYSLAVKYYKRYIFLPRMRMFCQYVDQSGGFLSPSVWMRQEAESELKISLKNVSICPNGIDTELFDFMPKFENVNKMLCIRPLSSRKYAVDTAIELLALLPEHFTLDIYGKGHLKEELLTLARKLNVENRLKITEEFIDRVEIPRLMSNYGTFLATTRMDAQGVIMCEAMSAGLITVSSNNTAIPEFVKDMETGLCEDNLSIVAKNLVLISTDKAQFDYITQASRAFIQTINIKNMTEKELSILI